MTTFLSVLVGGPIVNYALTRHLYSPRERRAMRRLLADAALGLSLLLGTAYRVFVNDAGLPLWELLADLAGFVLAGFFLLRVLVPLEAASSGAERWPRVSDLWRFSVVVALLLVGALELTRGRL